LEADICQSLWFVSVLNSFAYLAEEHESLDLANAAKERLLEVLNMTNVKKYSFENRLFAIMICKSYRIIAEPEGALTIFRMILDFFPGDVKVMREAVSLSRRYLFSLEGLVKIGARMPCKMIRQVVSLAPHELFCRCLKIFCPKAVFDRLWLQSFSGFVTRVLTWILTDVSTLFWL
jgi:hypothetical protein